MLYSKYTSKLLTAIDNIHFNYYPDRSEYNEEIVDNIFVRRDGYIYAIYNYYIGCVCFYRARSSDFKESIKIINFDDIEPNISNEVNKLISWIK